MYAFIASRSGSTFEVAFVVPVVIAAETYLTTSVFLPYKSKATVTVPADPKQNLQQLQVLPG